MHERPGMYHHVARAPKGRLLVRTHFEARALYHIVVNAFPEALAICVMPNHVHVVLPHSDPGDRLVRAMSAFTRWRNHSRRAAGPAWEPHPPEEEIGKDGHERRTLRYTWLNPGRAHMIRDPLAWPWSTYRDTVGLALGSKRHAERDAERLHSYVSSDPSVNVSGTELPVPQWGDVRWEDVLGGVASLYRLFPHEVPDHLGARRLAARTAWALDLRDASRLADALGVHKASVYRAVDGVPRRGASIHDPALATAVRVVGDPRFGAIPAGDMRLTPMWGKYRNLR